MLLLKEPDTQFTFALGSDTFMDLTNWKWKRSRDVMSLLEGRFVVLARPGDNGQHDTLQILQERIDQLNQDESGHAKLLRIPTLDAVSSTVIRSCRDEQVLESLLAPAVYAYIKEQKMYALGEA